jgi:hypothetical protein
MRLLSLPPLLLLTLLTLIHPSISALTSTPSSFCKCVCDNNSTIIALNAPSTTTSTPALHVFPRASSHKLSCADCTRNFCLSNNLPICKDVAEDQIFTSCFQRDSLKDELVIYLFLIVTTGLLVWAGAKPWIEALWERSGFGATPAGSGSAGMGRSYTPTGIRSESGDGSGRRQDDLQEEEDGRSRPR